MLAMKGRFFNEKKWIDFSSFFSRGFKVEQNDINNCG